MSAPSDAARLSHTQRARVPVREVLLTVLLIAAIIVLLFPFAWMILTSFRDQAQNNSPTPVWFFKPVLDNYKAVILSNNFLKFTWNSLVVAFFATGLGMLLGLPAAYSIARFNQRGLSLWILVSRVIPYITFLLPLFLVFTKFHMVGGFPALILSHLIITLPLIVWIMIAFFEDIPRDLEEAALVDGTTRAEAFVKVVLPLVTPGVVTAGILAMIFSWNQFLFSLILGGPDTKTVPVAVFNFISYGSIDIGGVAAAAVLITLPIVVLSLTVQRYIVKGLTAGGVKG